MNYSTHVPVKVFGQFNHSYGLPKPETSGAAGLDARANEKVTIRPGETTLVKTGLFMAIPYGYEVQVRPRSGLSLKTKLRVVNAPGTIDSCYRGEVCVIMENTGEDAFTIEVGDRVAQLVLQRVPFLVWDPQIDKECLGETDRGEGGFGSTGSK